MFSERHRFQLLRLARWSGPALAAIAVAGVATIALQDPASRGVVSWWIVSSALAPQRIIPLVGLGAALSLVSFGPCMAALTLFAAGIVAGSMLYDQLVSLFDLVPEVGSLLVLTAPISSIGAGLALMSPAALRAWLLALAALVIGTMLAVATRLTDPTLHDPIVLVAGALVGFWIVAVVLLTGRAFRQRWFGVAGRILGSWLMAIGLLYGAASLVPKQAPPLAPGVAAPEATTRIPNFDRSLSGLLPDKPARPKGQLDRSFEP